MTTASTNTTFDHSSDAAFRVWGLEMSTQFTNIGLLKTADTGQIDWVTVNRPGGANTSGGYEIRVFADTLQSTKPVYVKIEYGTGSATYPQVWVTVAVGSNGAGTLTGITTSRVTIGLNAAISSNVIQYQSRFCYKDGHVGMEWKRGSTANTLKPYGYFTITRTVDNNGAWTGDGVHFVYMNTSTAQMKQETINFTTSTVDTSQAGFNTSYAFSGGLTTATMVGFNPQCFIHEHNLPLRRPSIGSCSFLVSETTPDGYSSFALVGSTPRTYLVTSMKYGLYDKTEAYHAFLWE